jgi:PTH1 family peptidyl-tRNA hydrolase
MSADPLLIVGLANPGKEYEKTRHNAGAWLVEALANEANVNLRLDPKFHGLHAFTKLHGCPVHLLIPTTFMNRSGLSIQAVMGFYKLKPEQVLVAHDEIDLPAGVIRLKFDGGDGGHNGLKDTIRHLNSRQFYRLRIGVGRPAPGHDVADYVLNNPSKADRAQIDKTITQAVEVMPLILEGKIQAAMQELHTA